MKKFSTKLSEGEGEKFSLSFSLYFLRSQAEGRNMGRQLPVPTSTATSESTTTSATNTTATNDTTTTVSTTTASNSTTTTAGK